MNNNELDIKLKSISDYAKVGKFEILSTRIYPFINFNEVGINEPITGSDEFEKESTLAYFASDEAKLKLEKRLFFVGFTHEPRTWDGNMSDNVMSSDLLVGYLSKVWYDEAKNFMMCEVTILNTPSGIYTELLYGAGIELGISLVCSVIPYTGVDRLTKNRIEKVCIERFAGVDITSDPAVGIAYEMKNYKAVVTKSRGAKGLSSFKSFTYESDLTTQKLFGYYYSNFVNNDDPDVVEFCRKSCIQMINTLIEVLMEAKYGSSLTNFFSKYILDSKLDKINLELDREFKYLSTRYGNPINKFKDVVHYERFNGLIKGIIDWYKLDSYLGSSAETLAASYEITDTGRVKLKSNTDINKNTIVKNNNIDDEDFEQFTYRLNNLYLNSLVKKDATDVLENPSEFSADVETYENIMSMISESPDKDLYLYLLDCLILNELNLTGEDSFVTDTKKVFDITETEANVYKSKLLGVKLPSQFNINDTVNKLNTQILKSSRVCDLKFLAILTLYSLGEFERFDISEDKVAYMMSIISRGGRGFSNECLYFSQLTNREELSDILDYDDIPDFKLSLTDVFGVIDSVDFNQFVNNNYTNINDIEGITVDYPFEFESDDNYMISTFVWDFIKSQSSPTWVSYIAIKKYVI